MKKKYLLLDQGVLPEEADETLEILPKETKVIIVSRDPRDVYLSSLSQNKLARNFPNNVKDFCKIYANQYKHFLKQKNKNIVTNNIFYIDTLFLAKKLYPTMNSYSLASLAKYFGVNSGNHRAHSDVECLKNVYYNLLKELSNKTRLPVSYYKEFPQEVINYYQY